MLGCHSPDFFYFFFIVQTVQMIHPFTTAFLLGSLGAIQKIKRKSDFPISLVDFFIANCSANVAKDLHSIESDSANCVTHVDTRISYYSSFYVRAKRKDFLWPVYCCVSSQRLNWYDQFLMGVRLQSVSKSLCLKCLGWPFFLCIVVLSRIRATTFCDESFICTKKKRLLTSTTD